MIKLPYALALTLLQKLIVRNPRLNFIVVLVLFFCFPSFSSSDEYAQFVSVPIFPCNCASEAAPAECNSPDYDVFFFQTGNAFCSASDEVSCYSPQSRYYDAYSKTTEQISICSSNGSEFRPCQSPVDCDGKQYLGSYGWQATFTNPVTQQVTVTTLTECIYASVCPAGTIYKISPLPQMCVTNPNPPQPCTGTCPSGWTWYEPLCVCQCQVEYVTLNTSIDCPSQTASVSASSAGSFSMGSVCSLEKKVYSDPNFPWWYELVLVGSVPSSSFSTADLVLNTEYVLTCSYLNNCGETGTAVNEFTYLCQGGCSFSLNLVGYDNFKTQMDSAFPFSVLKWSYDTYSLFENITPVPLSIYLPFIGTVSLQMVVLDWVKKFFLFILVIGMAVFLVKGFL